MSWAIRKDLHLDVNAPFGRVLLASATDSSLLQPPHDLVAGDLLPVRIHFWERGANGTLTAADPGADTSLVFSARPANVPAGSDLLFLSNDFTEIEAGIWEGELNLSTAELAAHIAAAPAGPKTILGEIEVRDATGEIKRLSLQFPLTARPQSYDNQDAPTALPGPEEWLSIRGVRYDEDQALTEAQEAQGRENIKAAADEEVVKLAGAQVVTGQKTFSASPKSTGALTGDGNEIPTVKNIAPMGALADSALFSKNWTGGRKISTGPFWATGVGIASIGDGNVEGWSSYGTIGATSANSIYVTTGLVLKFQASAVGRLRGLLGRVNEFGGNLFQSSDWCFTSIIKVGAWANTGAINLYMGTANFNFSGASVGSIIAFDNRAGLVIKFNGSDISVFKLSSTTETDTGIDLVVGDTVQVELRKAGSTTTCTGRWRKNGGAWADLGTLTRHVNSAPTTTMESISGAPSAEIEIKAIGLANDY